MHEVATLHQREISYFCKLRLLEVLKLNNLIYKLTVTGHFFNVCKDLA